MFKKILNKKYIPLMILVVFMLLIIPATGQIYHQDEYSWLTQMDGTDDSPQVHPPLYLFLGRTMGPLIGFDHIRWLTVPFALANVLLVYAVSLKLTRRRSVALAATGLFVFNTYSVLAATMVDIDGALLPFFVLLGYWAYLNILEGHCRWYWILGLVFMGGWLSKESFVLFCGTLVADWTIRALEKRKENIQRLIRNTLPWIVGVGVVSFVIYVIAARVLPGVVAYAAHFNIFNFSSRAYADLAFKLLKSSVLLGPLLMLGGLAGLLNADNRRRYRFWWLYLLFSLLFYTVVFDFTTLTIERYFMFMIVPFVIIAAEPITNMLKMVRCIDWARVLLLIVAVVATLFIPHDVIPLYPKAAFAHRALSVGWNFLVPITGGSGPIGFYVSALFVGVSCLLMLGAVAMIRERRSHYRSLAAALFLGLGLLYTGVMLEEYLLGRIYGSPNRVAWETVNYVNNNPDIHQVITYYNIAPYDLRLSGKYNSRFFVTLKRDYVGRINAWRGHYMIVDFPAIASDDRYMAVINRCPITKEFQDKRIHSYIYDCTQLK